VASDDGRGHIVKRRAQLVAAALASVGGCAPECNPLVCLSPAPPDLRTAGPSAARPAQADGGIQQTLVGEARSGKAGAAIIVDDAPVYVTGLDEWPPGWSGKRVVVTGNVVTRHGLPRSPPPTEGGIVGPYRVVENATWQLATEDLK
jgi:hypothetical protein